MQATELTTSLQSVRNILIDGYRRALSTIRAVSILGSPFILQGLLSGLLDPWVNADRHSMYHSNILFAFIILGGSLLLLLLSIAAAYSHLTVLLYVRDVFYGEEKESLLDYWKPRASMGGLILLSLMFCIAAIPAGAIGLIGLALLLLPGLAWFALFFSAGSIIVALYLGKPDSGVVTAINDGVDIVRRYWLNAMLLGIGSATVIFAMVLPLAFMQGITMIIAHLLRDMTLASVMSAIIHGFISWITLVIGTVGGLFVYFSFINNCRSKENHVLPNL